MFEDAEAIANRKVEEIFCDTIAIGLFGFSYVRAFIYMISPFRPKSDTKYPDFEIRLKNIKESLNTFNIPEKEDLQDLFLKENSSDNIKKENNVIADLLCNEVAHKVRSEVQSFLDDKEVDGIDLNKVKDIEKIFRGFTPYSESCSISEIICAGWNIFYEIILLEDNEETEERIEKFHDLPKSEKINILKEIIMKSIEILEFNWKVRKSNDSKIL